MTAHLRHDESAQPDDRSADEIERDLAATRERLGGTLDALNTKLEVKSRARARIREAVEFSQRRARVLLDERGRELALAGGAAALAAVTIVVSRGRRS
ncbi:DUF3618 domain-containing protein [Demequina sp. SO4-13]|uniref:DUF3618 domain-containing protein n=1 Tax=Demequina sp. SO4-13 TaxID=3401027 RepID=UPI003AF7B55F